MPISLHTTDLRASFVFENGITKSGERLKGGRMPELGHEEQVEWNRRLLTGVPKNGKRKKGGRERKDAKTKMRRELV